MKNTQFVTYCPDIAPLPHDLCNAVLQIVNQGQDIFTFKDQPYKNFGYYAVTDAINAWCKQHFDFPFKAVIKTTKKELVTHIDLDASFAYNFIIDAGGTDVHTIWFNDVNSSTALEDHVFPEQQWIRIAIDQPHGVFNLDADKTRIILSVGNITKLNREAYRHQREVSKYETGYAPNTLNANTV